jgi:hypothetical protein
MGGTKDGLTLPTTRSPPRRTSSVQGSRPPLGVSPSTVPFPSASNSSATTFPSSCSTPVKTMVRLVPQKRVSHDGWWPTLSSLATRSVGSAPGVKTIVETVSV